MKNGPNSEGGAIAGLDVTKHCFAAPAVVLVIGILAIGLLIWAKIINERQQSNFTLTRALMGLQIKVANTHLWFEEALIEENEDLMALAFYTLDWAEKLAQMVLNGGVPVGGMDIERLGEERLRKQAEDIAGLLREYRILCQERRLNPAGGGVGSTLDQYEDQAYNTIQQRISVLEKDVETTQLADRKKVGRLFYGILLAWLVIVLAATAGIWNRERRRREAATLLVKANEQLLSQAEELRAHREHLTELVDTRTVDLTAANERLRSEIVGRQLIERALQVSEKQLRHLAARLMTAQEEERWRIASELHDDLGHALTIVKLRLKSIERCLQEKDALTEGAKETVEYVDQVIEKVRRLSRELSPSVLHVLGLTEALRQLIDNFCKNIDCVVTFDIEDNVRLLFPEDAQIMIYRVIQEALTNIGKHAQAKKVFLTVQKTEDRISFVIEDDGRGFNQIALSLRDPDGKGMGLATMEERVMFLGGKFAVDSEEGKGTRIAVDIPLPEVKL